MSKFKNSPYAGYKANREGDILGIYGRIMKPHKKPNGYLKINMKGLKTRHVHRIIAQTFIPNPENKPQINHKNGIKTDNRVLNLEWCTGAENIQHGIGLFNKSQIKVIREAKKFGLTYLEISFYFNASSGNLSDIVNRKLYKNIL